jgi:succinate dehydrogenase / fumarate reductase cytochrome b subunit
MMTRLLSSSVGLKLVMAVSGALLALFLVLHVLGNLEIFAGAEAINRYGALLRVFPPLLWTLRFGLLVLLVLHLGSAVRLAAINGAARPVGYAQKRRRTTTLAARTMLASGIALTAFVVFHILHFTVRSVEPAYRTMHDAMGRHDVFGMVTDAFRRPAVTIIYVVAMLLLGLHLGHGVASMVHTLGVNHPRYNPAWRHAGTVFALLIVTGFVAVPLAILAGVVR